MARISWIKMDCTHLLNRVIMSGFLTLVSATAMAGGLNSEQIQELIKVKRSYGPLNAYVHAYQVHVQDQEDKALVVIGISNYASHDEKAQESVSELIRPFDHVAIQKTGLDDALTNQIVNAATVNNRELHVFDFDQTIGFSSRAAKIADTCLTMASAGATYCTMSSMGQVGGSIWEGDLSETQNAAERFLGWAAFGMLAQFAQNKLYQYTYTSHGDVTQTVATRLKGKFIESDSDVWLLLTGLNTYGVLTYDFHKLPNFESIDLK